MEFCQCDCALEGFDVCQLGDETECDRLSMQLQLTDMETVTETTATGSAVSYLPPTYGGGWSGHGRTPSVRRSMCVHALDPYTLSNGTTIYLSGAFDQRFRDWSPDIGMYLDGGWDDVTESFSYLIPWADYGLPWVSNETLIRYAQTALNHCDAGETVEIGCLGSHGRTGTFVAILEIVASNGRLTAHDAIAKVRAEHCVKAVETEIQEWYVKAIRATIRQEPIPPKPRPMVAATSTATTAGNGPTTAVASPNPVTPRVTGIQSQTALQLALQRMESRDRDAVAHNLPTDVTSAVDSLTARSKKGKRGHKRGKHS